MSSTAADAAPALADIAVRVDAELEAFLSRRRDDAVAIAPAAAEPVDEIARSLRAGGKRIRPAFCYWGYRAAAGVDGPEIWRAAAALELFHTMALIHDDVLDRAGERRGAPTVVARQAAAAEARGQADPAWVGVGVGLVTGDLAAAFADELFASAGFPSDRQRAGAERFQRMRAALGAGAYLDLVRADLPRERLAALKGGAYTVEHPLLIGAALAGGSSDVDAALIAYARPLGTAFQLLDDLADGEAASGATRDDALRLVAAAAAALDDHAITPPAAAALRALADLVGTL
jgi:geranylgeranyl diphosphate synthase, type I